MQKSVYFVCDVFLEPGSQLNYTVLCEGMIKMVLTASGKLALTVDHCATRLLILSRKN
jgi:hypothetical protein